ncbi:arylesterase [Granulicella sp. 5B5]|nr:arylesterase [Granulicella sp. 5B5]
MGLSLCIALSGCKSSTSSAETVESAPTGAPIAAEAPVVPVATDTDAQDTRPVIACFGDSLTAGYGADPGQSYPDDLQRRLDAQGYRYHVVNEGVSGETTKDGLERVDRVAARHPKIVVLEFGGNDGLRGLPLEQTQSNLAAMIESLKKSGAEVVLAGITLPPEYGPDYIAKINAIYPALAKKYHVRLLPFLLQGVYGTPGDMQEDGHHATAQGNKQVAANVEKLIQPMLRK